jgi:hypothetical protein
VVDVSPQAAEVVWSSEQLEVVVVVNQLGRREDVETKDINKKVLTAPLDSPLSVR